MKTSYILSIFAAPIMSVSLTAAVINTSTRKINAGGDSKSAKSNSKETTSGNYVNAATPASADADLAYLRFDVAKYAEKDLNNINDDDASQNSAEKEFSYLKFDVGRYIDQDDYDSENQDANQKEVDNTDYSFLKFDVTKYIRNDQNQAGE